MTKIRINKAQKERLLDRYDAKKELAQKIRENPEVLFHSGVAIIPIEVLSLLLARSYSAIRIKVLPKPVEVYWIEASTAVEYERRNENSLSLTKLSKTKGLSEYLERSDKGEHDSLLDAFKNLKHEKIRTEEKGDVVYHTFNSTRATKNLRGSARPTGPKSGDKTVLIHSHPGTGTLYPGISDQVYSCLLCPQGILEINYEDFASFALNWYGQTKSGLILRKYEQDGTEKNGYFIPVNRVHKLAEAYVKKRILSSLENYVKTSGSPILIWDFAPMFATFVEGDPDLKFFDKYEIV